MRLRAVTARPALHHVCLRQMNTAVITGVHGAWLLQAVASFARARARTFRRSVV